MSLFEKFITDGNEKADEPAKEGAMLDGGDMAQIRASTVPQKSGFARSTAKRMQFSVSGGRMAGL